MKSLCLLFIILDCTATIHVFDGYDFKILKEELKSLQDTAHHFASQHNNDQAHNLLFEKYIKLFKRNYASDEKMKEKRLAIFKDSLARHRWLNDFEDLHNGTAKYGINQFSDWSSEEFKNYVLGSDIEKQSFSDALKIHLGDVNPNGYCNVFQKKYPGAKDWIEQSTKIKDQKSCGSCWAFVASEQVETYLAIAGQPIVELSPQNLISCAPSLGCQGGNTCAVLKWMLQTQMSLETEKEYPYEGQKSKCIYSNHTTSNARVRAVCGCQSFVGKEESMIYILSQKGPLSVNVDAISWQDYLGGVIQHHCTNKNINHAVQLIGYNMNDVSVAYWKARNQWGPLFGEDGYVRLKYGANICGVAEQPSFIVV